MKQLVFAIAVLLHYAMADPNDLSVSQASNYFATQLFQQELARTSGNVLVCPLSVHIALALVHQGAGGSTADELAKALHLPGSNENIRSSYKTLLTGLQDDALKIATKLYPAISFKPKPDYVSVAQEYFLSDIQALDFTKSIDSANIINKFVENKTNNKIHDIVQPDSLSGLTRLIIVNAVHFKGGWDKTFPPSFTDNFKVTRTETIKTDFMSQTDYFPFKTDPSLDAKVLKLNYKYGKYSMVFVLPNKEDGLKELEAKLATTSMDSILSGLQNVRVEVTIPKFKIEQEIKLKDVLVKMGIVSMFDSRANLSNIADGDETLYVDSVIQKTFIDVNEKGTEAAAATGVVTPLSGGSEENTFSAQRPFLFYLIHNIPPLVILFHSRLVKPQGKPTPSSELSNNFNDKQSGNSNLNTEINGNFNRINGFQQGSGFNIVKGADHNYATYYPEQTTDLQRIRPNNQPKVNYVQNINHKNIPTNTNHGQNSQINRFNQNYPQPQTTPYTFGQNRRDDPVYNQFPSQSRQPGDGQYAQAGLSQQYQPQGPQPTNNYYNPHV